MFYLMYTVNVYYNVMLGHVNLHLGHVIDGASLTKNNGFSRGKAVLPTNAQTHGITTKLTNF